MCTAKGQHEGVTTRMDISSKGLAKGINATWKSHTHERNMRLNIMISPNKAQNLTGYLPKLH